MQIHDMVRGNLVTQKGTTWQFSVKTLDPSPMQRITWSIGTPFTSNTFENARRPRSWTPLGTGETSDSVRFDLAAPHYVRVVIETLIRDTGERFGEPAAGGGAGSADRPVVPPGTGSGGDPEGVGTGARPGVDGTLLRPLGGGGADESGPGVGGTVERPDDTGTLGRPVGREDGPVDRVARTEIEVVVYPGLVLALKGPEILAQATEGYVPVMFQVWGFGEAVRITSPLEYTIRVPRRRPVKDTNATFVRAVNRQIDKPPECCGNGTDHTYIFYMKPAVIRTIGRNGNGSPQSPAAVKGQILVDFRFAARPRAVETGDGRLGGRYDKITTYIDDRPYLLHMSKAGPPPKVLSMAQDPARTKQAREFVTVQSTPLLSPGHFNGDRVPDSLSGDGERLFRNDASSEDGTDVTLDVAVKDDGGWLYDGHVCARTEGARRGAAVAVYYPLERDLYVPGLVGPFCKVDSPDSANVFVSVFGDDPMAQVEISGLADYEPQYFDYGGLAVTALGIISGTRSGATAKANANGMAQIVSLLAGAGFNTAAKIGGIAALPFGPFPLLLITAAANLIWSYNKRPKPPRSGGEVGVTSALTLETADGGSRPIGNKPLASATASLDDNTGGQVELDVSFGAAVSVAVGHVLRMAQIFSVGTMQRQDQGLATRSFITKQGFEKALSIKAV